MKIFDITQYIEGIPQEDIRNEIIKNLWRITVDYPMSYINSSNSHLDIVHNYIEASYIAEELGKHAASITAEEISRYPYSPICRYKIVVKDIEPFVEKLRRLSIVLSNDQEDDDILSEHQENLNTHAESLDNKIFHCPDLVEEYYANLVGGAYFELESELDDGFLSGEYKKYPEREYGFWKSAYSKTIGEDFYVSSECWVVPLRIDIRKVLLEYSGLSSKEIYDKATLFSLENISYLSHQYGIVYFPFSQLLRAKKFVAKVIRKLDTDEETNEYFQTYSPKAEDIMERYNISLSIIIPFQKYLLSRSSLSIIVEDRHFRYVFFPEQVKGNKITALYNQISTIFGFVGEFAGVIRSVNLSWENFDDEKFESLCYDIIYHHPKFDNQTIRKMGKSRSRDGGRDIVVHTKERPGSPRKMFIFQCKFTKVGSSLTTRKVNRISDIIVQYRAQGYGVMTPVVIDSALYDRIDAICCEFKIESDNWSILEIERFIARHPNLKKRHFKSRTTGIPGGLFEGPSKGPLAI
jgi:hypothetical protein